MYMNNITYYVRVCTSTRDDVNFIIIHYPPTLCLVVSYNYIFTNHVHKEFASTYHHS